MKIKKNKEEIKVLENKLREVIPEWIKVNSNSFFDPKLVFFIYYYIKYNYENSGKKFIRLSSFS